MEAQIPDGLAKAVPVPPSFSEPTEKSKLPVWDSGHLRLAIAAAVVALWSWNVDTNRFTMDERAFELWGVPLSEYVTFDDLSAHIHPADRDRVHGLLDAFQNSGFHISSPKPAAVFAKRLQYTI